MMDELLKSVRSIDTRLGNLEVRVDERLRETRPIWEQVLAEIAALRAGHEHTNARLDQLAAGQEELRAGQDQLRTGQDQLRTGQDQLRAGQDQLRTELRDEMRMGFHKVERQLMLLGRDFLQIRSELVMLEDRVEKLEPKPS